MVQIYSGILLSHKKEKIMPFAATWINLKIIILSEESQRKTYIGSNKTNTKELIHKTETKSKISKPNLWLLKGKC